MKNLPEKEQSEQKLELSSQGYVRLPFEQGEFKEFVVGLLGKPQSISGVIEGAFEVNDSDIRNLYDLINQRILQQNEATLIQFTARTIYSNKTSILINSIEEFISYNEIKPIVSESLHLTFQYLIKFQDKNVPEKQEINISFITNSNKEKDDVVKKDYDELILKSIVRKNLEKAQKGIIQYTIKHTARTWGADLDSILSNHFKTLLKPISKFNIFLHKYNALIGLAMWFSIIGIGFYFGSNHVDQLIIQRNLQIDTFFSETAQSMGDISKQLKYLMKNPYSFRDAEVNYIIPFLIFGGIMSLITISLISMRKNSFILLTKESIKIKEIIEKKYTRQFIYFFTSIILSIGCSIIANYIFECFK